MSYKKKYKVPKVHKKDKGKHPYNIQKGNYYPPLFLDMTLQRSIGNQEVQRMFKTGEILAKLFVNQPGDVYEQEANRVAQQIVNMGDKEAQLKSSETKIQKKGVSFGGESVSSQTEAGITSLKGKGQPLEPKIRDYLQPRFGVDLKDVRVHTDSNADRLARAIRARAFTLGNDVVFAKGEYKPGTKEGKKLVAHELTHVLQQGENKNNNCNLIRRDKSNSEFEEISAYDLSDKLSGIAGGKGKYSSPNPQKFQYEDIEHIEYIFYKNNKYETTEAIKTLLYKGDYFNWKIIQNIYWSYLTTILELLANESFPEGIKIKFNSGESYKVLPTLSKEQYKRFITLYGPEFNSKIILIELLKNKSLEANNTHFNDNQEGFKVLNDCVCYRLGFDVDLLERIVRGYEVKKEIIEEYINELKNNQIDLANQLDSDKAIYDEFWDYIVKLVKMFIKDQITNIVEKPEEWIISAVFDTLLGKIVSKSGLKITALRILVTYLIEKILICNDYCISFDAISKEIRNWQFEWSIKDATDLEHHTKALISLRYLQLIIDNNDRWWDDVLYKYYMTWKLVGYHNLYFWDNDGSTINLSSIEKLIVVTDNGIKFASNHIKLNVFSEEVMEHFHPDNIEKKATGGRNLKKLLGSF